MKSLLKTSMLTALVAGSLLAGPAIAEPPAGTKPADKTEKKDKNYGEKKAEKKADKAGVAVGEKAPAFTLTDTNGKTVNLADFQGKTVVLEWFNPECPFVVKHHKLNSTMVDTFNQFKGQDVVWLAINSGAPGKQGAGLDLNKKMVAEWNVPYPVLLDESGTVGRSYGAKTTPHMFVINKEGTVVYAGAIDDNNSAKEVGKTNYVAKALTQLSKGESITDASTKPYGCSVKYGDK